MTESQINASAGESSSEFPALDVARLWLQDPREMYLGNLTEEEREELFAILNADYFNSPSIS